MADNKKKSGNKADTSKDKEYVSPLGDELNFPLIDVGEGVQIYHDRKNGRILADIDIDTRRGLSSKGKTVKIATATYPIEGKKKLSLNVYDKGLTDEELDEQSDFIDRKLREKENQDKLKALD